MESMLMLTQDPGYLQDLYHGNITNENTNKKNVAQTFTLVVVDSALLVPELPTETLTN